MLLSNDVQDSAWTFDLWLVINAKWTQHPTQYISGFLSPRQGNVA